MSDPTPPTTDLEVWVTMTNLDQTQPLRRVLYNDERIVLELWPDTPEAVQQDITPRGADTLATYLGRLVKEQFTEQYHQIVAEENARRDTEWLAIHNARLAEEEAERATWPEPPECPDWCDMDAGHRWEDKEDDEGSSFIRYHSRNLGVDLDNGKRFSVSIDQEERFIAATQQVELDPAAMHLEAPDQGVSPAQARLISRALLITADHLEEIALAR